MLVVFMGIHYIAYVKKIKQKKETSVIKEQDVLNMEFGDVIDLDGVILIVRFIDGWIVESCGVGQVSSVFVPDHRKAGDFKKVGEQIKLSSCSDPDQEVVKNIMEYEF